MKAHLLILLATIATVRGQDSVGFKNTSFEEPQVRQRTSESEGANPSNLPEDATSWTHFQSTGRPKTKSPGKLVVGLTNEYARTGKQALFVDFQQVEDPNQRGFITSNVLPVKAGHRYRVSIWGRIDRKRPLSLDQRRPMLRTEIEFFTPDLENQAGETDYRTQMIPGGLDRLLFTSSKWTEYFAITRAPEDAGFVKVVFRWELDRSPGMTDGCIYFDDIAIEEMPGGASLAPLDPSMIKPRSSPEDEGEEEPDTPVPNAPTPAPAPAAPAAPAPPK